MVQFSGFADMVSEAEQKRKVPKTTNGKKLTEREIWHGVRSILSEQEKTKEVKAFAR